MADCAAMFAHAFDIAGVRNVPHQQPFECFQWRVQKLPVQALTSVHHGQERREFLLVEVPVGNKGLLLFPTVHRKPGRNQRHIDFVGDGKNLFRQSGNLQNGEDIYLSFWAIHLQCCD